MNQNSFTNLIAAAISGVLTFISVIHVTFISTWFCFVPLFVLLVNSDKKTAFRAGIIFGTAIALPSFYWMIPGAQRFTGSSIIYGIIVFSLSTVLLALYFACINYLFVYLKSKKRLKYSFIQDAFLLAAIYTVAEALLMNATTGMPWFGFHSGNGLLANIYAIQPASVFGMHALSFVIVFINYYIAIIITSRRWMLITGPAIVICLYFGWGYMLLKNTDGINRDDNPVKIAVLNANIPPEIKWDENNGNKLVEILLRLDSIAAAQHPDIILWSESAIPWTYRKDDDLVKELLRISSVSKPTHLLGMNTDYSDNYVYNSVYAISADGTVQGRYDKRFRLSFIESSFAGFSFPFFSSSGFMVQKGTSDEPLPTSYGKAGVMICNESTLPQSASSMVNKGAEFLVNLSNDGWFNDTYLVDLHFWNAKLRAVESRRDIVVNSNNGYEGLIRASGEVTMQEISEEPSVKIIAVNKNNELTLAAKFPFLFVYVCALYIAAYSVWNVLKNKPAESVSANSQKYKVSNTMKA